MNLFCFTWNGINDYIYLQWQYKTMILFLLYMSKLFLLALNMIWIHIDISKLCNSCLWRNNRYYYEQDIPSNSEKALGLPFFSVETNFKPNNNQLSEQKWSSSLNNLYWNGLLEVTGSNITHPLKAWQTLQINPIMWWRVLWYYKFESELGGFGLKSLLLAASATTDSIVFNNECLFVILLYKFPVCHLLIA